MDKLNSKNLIELVKSAKKGNKNAFSELYEYYITPIFRFVYFRVRNRVDAEDLTQSIFLKTWSNLSKYKQRKNPFSFYPVGSRGDSFGAWLYTIARNTVTDFWKKKKDWSISELAENAIKSKEEPIDDLIEKEENLSELKKVIELLTDEQQEVIILRFIDGLSNKEISRILDKKEDAVRQIQSRAIKILREYIKK
ncbi:MAG: RNA polymerase sigma factor [bacterium]|nr:RNA polymerase sigma factor [bacterium]